MKILVTGGAGFIGSHLVESLIDAGHVVTAFDDLSTGKVENINPQILTHPKFQLVRGDICERVQVDCFMKDADAVVHLAAVSSVPKSFLDPIRTNKVNVEGFINVMQSAIHNDVKRMVYMSSAAIYGDIASVYGNQPIQEEFDANAVPLSPYAITKRANEQYAQLYDGMVSTDIIGLRLFNAYGPKQDANSAYAAVIPKWINAVLDRKPIGIYGDGLSVRDFIYVDDVVRTIESVLMPTPYSDQRRWDKKIYNVASGEPIKMRTLVWKILTIAEDLMGSRNVCSIIDELDERVGDIRFSCADIFKSRYELDGFARTPLDDGLRLTFEWHMKQRKVDKIENNA